MSYNDFNTIATNDLPSVHDEKPNMRFDYQYEERTPQPEPEPLPPTPEMAGWGSTFHSYEDDRSSSPVPSNTSVLSQDDFRLPPLSPEAMAYSNDESLAATVAFKQAVDEHLASLAVVTPEVDYETVTWKEIETQRRENITRELTKKRSLIALFRLKKEVLRHYVAMCEKSTADARQQMEKVRADGIASLIRDAGLAPPHAERQVNDAPRYVEAFGTHMRESHNHDACQTAYYNAHKDVQRWTVELQDYVDGLRSA